MAEPSYETDNAAEMDYPAHEQTYELFLGMAMWGTIAVIAILLGMLVGLIAGGGIIGGLATFVVVLAIAYYLT